MAEKFEDLAFAEFIVKSIVGNSKDVKVDRIIDERGVLLTLNINQADMGYVIGRQGKTVGAIRTLLKVVGAKNDARVTLKINEPEGGSRARRSAGVATEVDTDVVDD